MASEQLVLLFLAMFALAHGYEHFRDRIPNGDNVRHPLNPDLFWRGVGHRKYQGSGPRNPFGLAFANWGYEWNRCLCEEDSDNDGKTNGEELGDPYCEWKEGDMPYRTTDITHPGICNNFSRDCRDDNWWVTPPDTVEKCAGLDSPDVMTLNLTYPLTEVPSRETTYWCQAFNVTAELPADMQDKDFHMLATSAIIYNKEIMHHTLLYACGDQHGEQIMQDFSEPVECGMATDLCTDVVAVWGVGVDWFCNNENAGVPIGKNGIKYFVMQHHWNNPQLKSDYVDASGMTLYITENKRPYDSAVWFVGAPFIQIPPNWPSYLIEGGCSTECMEKTLLDNIFLTHLFPHMHYLGKAFRFQIWRNGTLHHENYVDVYSYETPEIFVYDPPIELYPTDEIRVDCFYQSKGVEQFTYYGEATADEMCFAILNYYPFSANISDCSTNPDGYGYCAEESAKDSQVLCDVNEFGATVYNLGQTLLEQCSHSGLACLSGCQEALAPFESLGCLNTPAEFEYKTWMAYYISCELNQDCSQYNYVLNALASCEFLNPPVLPGDDKLKGICEDPTPPPSSAGSYFTLSTQLCVIALMARTGYQWL